MQPQDVCDIIDAAAAHMKQRAKRHTIHIERPAGLMMVNADSALLVQLLDNLIENALKYSGEQSHIVLSAQKENRQITIRVADDGPGIPDNEKENVFQMYYTTQNQPLTDNRRGLGLGLALCKIIVQEHNGSICVRDAVPHGAVFEVTLPALEENNE